MQLIERRQGSVTIVNITGAMRLTNGVQEFRDLIVRIIGEGRGAIVLNMAACPLVDSAGLGELATALVRVHNTGGQLVLSNVNERVRDLLRVTQLLPLFAVHANEGSAVDAVHPS